DDGEHEGGDEVVAGGMWGGSKDDVDGGVIMVAMLWLAAGRNLAGGGRICGGGKMGARVFINMKGNPNTLVFILESFKIKVASAR
ncbi:hypothetical protein Tco_0034737, partial [Tanacetum coccineum]